MGCCLFLDFIILNRTARFPLFSDEEFIRRIDNGQSAAAYA